jgi:hypothetical protein
MLFQDLKITARHLRKCRGFSAAAVLMLAMGIGATTAIFSIANGVLLFVMLLAMAASLVPARAASIDPTQ